VGPRGVAKDKSGCTGVMGQRMQASEQIRSRPNRSLAHKETQLKRAKENWVGLTKNAC
jgi:hypothetical protein